jgi:hypothetical protein
VLKAKALVLVLLSFISINSFAGYVKSTISKIQVNSDKVGENYSFLVFFSQEIDSADCVSDSQNRMIGSLETESGRALYSALLAARLSGNDVEVWGSKLCVNGIEKISFIRL